MWGLDLGLGNEMWFYLQVTEEEGALQEAQIVGIRAERWRQGGVQCHVGRGRECRANVDLGAGHGSIFEDNLQE